MKSSCKKEDTDVKKKYVFFSDPDIIVQRAETSAAAAQVKQNLQFQQQQGPCVKQLSTGNSTDLPIQFDLKGLENLLSYHPVQPYPFTFISAVKRKLALSDSSDSCKKAYEPREKTENQPPVAVLKTNSAQNLYHVVEKMDFIRPLKVPDLKIAPKTLDFSSRENSLSKELSSGKFEPPSKEIVHERAEKKGFERVQRKLDFSGSEGPSIINSDIVGPLKMPNISIASNLSKKKEHIRENSREKENRSKRIKKDDSLYVKQDEAQQDIFKRSKSPRHISRKELGDNSSDTSMVTKLKSDRMSFHMPRESDFASTKPKTKNFATSTVKKDSDKKHRSLNIRSLKLTRDNSVDSRSRTCSNESLSERSMQLPEKVTTRESSRNMFENAEYRYKDDFHLLLQGDEQKHIFSPEINRQGKQHKSGNQLQGKLASSVFKEQTKRISEKGKPSANKAEVKSYIINSEESGDIETATEPNVSLRVRSPSTSTSMQQMKNKESEKAVQSTQSVSLSKSSKTIEDSKCTDDSLQQCVDASIKKDEQSFTQTISTPTKQTSTTNESKDLNESTISEALLDPRKISFRDDSRLQQPEFCDLVTPDMNLLFRSKRKKQLIQSNNSEADIRRSKYTPVVKMETEQESIQLLHPSALHLQFQAELHLLDSFDESLRQVMDVEKCFYNVKRDHEKHIQSVQQNNAAEESKVHSKAASERGSANSEPPSEISKFRKHTTDKVSHTSNEVHHTRYTSPVDEDKMDNNLRKLNKPAVKAVEVQTQTANDIATQTDARTSRCSIQSRCPDIRGITYERGVEGYSEIPELSLDSAEQFEDLDQIEEISLPSKLRTMSEISLHETTSSIRTETGTEISISTRDVTCSFNKYLDLEIAQLIKDEKQRYDKIEMLFKSREKTLNDRTKKLVKLEEQKRALRDTGQDSRISSVKKKQRALLLKLQQEKDEMNRLKELHKIASQERKLMLQKQRNMFNPQMSTKNILTKLKRSADSQSPRRLSGPMKGYDIRSNSSMSSLVDSDKSQHDRSQADTHLQISESDLHFSKIDLQKGDKFINFVEESNTSLSRLDKSNEGIQGDTLQDKSPYMSPKEGARPRYEIKSRNFEDKMPRSDILRLKSHQFDVESKLISGRSVNKAGQYLFEKEKSPDTLDLLQQNLNKSVSENAKSESDTLVEEFSKKSKPSQSVESHYQNMVSPRERDSVSRSIAMNTETIQEEINFVSQDSVSKTSKSSQVSEDILQTLSKSSKKSSKSIATDKDISKKTQYNSESKSSSKRKSSKCQKSKSSSSILTENILRSKSNSQMSEEFIKHHNKRTKVEKEFIQSDKKDDTALLDNTDLNVSDNTLQALVKHTKGPKDKGTRLLNDMEIDCESKENVSCQKMHERNLGTYEKSSHNQQRSVQNVDNVSAKSEVSTYAVSHHSSGESERNYSKSVVVRSQDQDFKTSKKLEQILNAREAALASRKNCVEEWMAWHAKLRAEEDRVARMEQAALKLVTATSSVFSQQDTTVSSDTSDVEGRIELLTEKLAERRIEMSRLKREARKQTKQKLRALEANLLTQIKKYDTTIHEMRKKLESKKGISKDIDKLAIESKSLADFKVPEIPLKRIRDIYKSSDLLRSRSESDLLSTKGQSKDVRSVGSARTENVEEKFEKSGLQKSAKGTKSVHSSGHLSSVKLDTIDQSIQSIFDECISEQIECDKIGSASISSTSDEAHSDKHIRYGSKTYADETRSKQTAVSEAEKITTVPSQDSISEDIQTEMSTAKSETAAATISGDKLSRNDSSEPSEVMEQKVSSYASMVQFQQKGISVESTVKEIQDSEYTPPASEKSNAEVKTEKSASEILDFSRKLDFLRLNNKNLNDDLSSLENELKALSEMVSRFNAKSKEASKTELQVDDKSTSKDVSEMTLRSEKDDQTSNLEIQENDESKELDDHWKGASSEISTHLTNSAKLKLSSDLSNNKNIVENADDVISVIIPNDEISLSRPNQEIDYEARTKEILNEIEKSIISEHINTAEYDSNRSRTLFESDTLTSHKDADDLSNEVVSLDTSVSGKRMPEIYSKVISSKESVSKSSNIPEPIYDSGKIASVHESFTDERTLKSEQSSSTVNRNLLTSIENANSLQKDVALNSFRSPDRSSQVRLHAVSNEALGTTFAKQSTVSEHIHDLSRAQSPQPSLDQSLAKPVQEDDTHRTILSTTEHLSFTPGEHKNKSDAVSHTKSKYDKHVSVEDVQSLHKVETSRNNEDIRQDTLQSASSFIADEISKDENQSELISTGKVSLDRDDWTISDSFDAKPGIHDSENDRSESQHLQSYSDNSSSNFSDTRNESQPFEDTKLQEENLASDIEVSLFIPKGESTNIETYGIKFDESTIDAHDVKRNDDLDDILDIITKDDGKRQPEKENVQTSDADEFDRAIQDSVTKILDKVEKSIETSPVGERIDSHGEEVANEAEVEIVASNDNKSDSSSSILNFNWQDEDQRETDVDKVEEDSPSISDDVHEEKEITDERNKSLINVSLRVELVDEDGTYHTSSKSQEIVITELEPGSVEGEILPELEIDAKVELAEEDFTESNVLSAEFNHEVDKDYDNLYNNKEDRVKEVDAQKSLEPITELDSSDGEQLDNLVEVAESGLDVIEKKIERSSPDSVSHIKLTSRDGDEEEDEEVALQDIQPEELSENKSEKDNDITTSVNVDSSQLFDKSDGIKSSAAVTINNKTFDILKDPEYEDISEESLEVSEILDKSDAQKSASSQKSSGIPEKYQATHKSEEVLRILDEIAQKSLTSSESTSRQSQLKSKQIGDIADQLGARNKSHVKRFQPEGSVHDVPSDDFTEEQALSLAVDTLQDRTTEATGFEDIQSSSKSIDITKEKAEASKLREDPKNKSPEEVYKSEKKVSEKQDQDASSESSEGAETPRGVSEIEIDSPRDLNDSKLDVDSLNDDLLNSNNAGTQSTEQKSNYHATPIVGTSEKDIEVMIDKLKASLGQPGLEVAELEAKLLRIEQLQIELEIKKLEAEEVSYYVREIPNKPPPPYTPPGGGARISTSLASPSPPPAVIPSNVDELTAFTEKATALIFKAKQAGEDIMSLEAPPEIYALTKETNETVKKDRRIYNTFLFDLCKETIAEIYRAEYEKPGPSWTKPNVKTKPIMKIPKNVEELNEYVNKEVATLFGFKTKLQRENMVMRWSRKRRDRVDELLAREAQAEEDEWTKFHHDELAVKNGLTVAILDSLIMETVNVVKVAYAKKRKIMI